MNTDQVGGGGRGGGYIDTGNGPLNRTDPSGSFSIGISGCAIAVCVDAGVEVGRRL